jgi:hypothetical protein
MSFHINPRKKLKLAIRSATIVNLKRSIPSFPSFHVIHVDRQLDASKKDLALSEAAAARSPWFVGSAADYVPACLLHPAPAISICKIQSRLLRLMPSPAQ